jgi:hypothetical protein
MIFFFKQRFMFLITPRRLLLFSVASLVALCGFAVLQNQSGKISGHKKADGLHWKTQTTGAATVSYDTTKAADFLEHRLEGQLLPNTLYQGFLAVHYDELDSVFHSAVGRTNGAASPGDLNTFNLPDPAYLVFDSTGYTLRYSLDTVDNFHIKQVVRAVRDSSNTIFLNFIFEFINPTGLSTRFSNFKMIFGYDGDIGNTAGGYQDDSTGFYADDSVSLAYVFDQQSSMYGGVGLAGKNPNAAAGNYAWLHHTINDSGRTRHDLDTLLKGLMDHPNFSSAAQNADVSVYWTVNLGTIQPADTVRDTVQFVLVNGVTRNSLIQSAHGRKGTVQNQNVTAIGNSIPTSIILHANYPNPFNPTTTIKFELPLASKVSIKIYNILGQEVTELLGREMPAGFHTVVWNGRNNRNDAVASGIYFYRMIATVVNGKDKFVKTSKMTLIK